MNKRIFYIAIILTLLSGNLLIAQDFAPVGTAVAQFLEIGIGARSLGMAEAFTATPDNPDAGIVFWNPAGLADVADFNLFSSYTRWPADISVGGLAFAIPAGNLGTFAVNVVYLLTNDMEITTIDQPEGTGEMFGISNYALGISYARHLTDRLSIGMTAKLVHEKYLTYGYNSWAIDIGTLYRTNFRGLTIGMSILHFGPEVQFGGSYIDYSDPLSVDVDNPKSFETYSLPINFRFGLSMDVIRNEQHTLVAAVDMIHPNNNLEQYNVGMEYNMNKLLFVRGGYQIDDNEGGLAVGAGVALKIGGNKKAILDYAFSEMGVLKSVHNISFALSF